jgi:nucleolar pre-ribosomal-associated protein 2
VLRAKKITSQHIHVLLTTYIKLTLEMAMKTEVKEVLKPGIWAIWGCIDSTGRELRKAVVDGLDAPGRAVWGQLWREWQVWGR